ncbi:MAG: histidine kinase [Gemmatirosa sp.]
MSSLPRAFRPHASAAPPPDGMPQGMPHGALPHGALPVTGLLTVATPLATAAAEQPRRGWPLVLAAWAGYSAMMVMLFELTATQGSRTFGWSVPVMFGVGAFWAAATPLVRRLTVRLAPERVGMARSVALHGAAALALSVTSIVLRWALFALIYRGEGAPSLLGMLGRLLDYYVFLYALLVALARAANSHRAYVERARHALLAEARLARARLAYLQRQLQPHFLFNALNVTAELTQEAPSVAERMLRQLARLLRAATAHLTEAEVRLRDELHVLDAYVDVQRTRFGDALQVTYDFDPRAMDLLVPAFVLQPLVENAIRHGLASGQGRVRVTTALGPDEQGGERLRLEVTNDGAPPLSPERSSGGRTGGHGIGLRNTRDRLAQLYGNWHRLEIRYAPGVGTTVELELPARPAPAHMPTRVGAAPVESAPPIDAAIVVELAPAAAPRREANANDAALANAASLGSVASVAAVGSAPAEPEGDDAAVSPGLTVPFRAIAGFWTACALVWCLQVLLMGLGGIARLDEARNYLTQFVGAGTWALLTPLVLWLARRVRLSREQWAGPLALHVVVCAALAVAQVAVARTVFGSDVPLFSIAVVFPMTLNGVIYASLVAWSHARDFSLWHRERAVATARLEADLEVTRVRSVAVELRPEFVAGVLTGAADVAVAHPERAESIVEELADLLRTLLDESRATRAPTVREELALLGQSLDLLSLTAGRPVRLRSDVPADLQGATLSAGALRRVLDIACARVALADADALEVRVTVTAGASDAANVSGGVVRVTRTGPWLVARVRAAEEAAGNASLAAAS